MPNRLSQYFTMTRRRPAFLLGLMAVFGTACLLEVAANTDLIWAAQNEAARKLSGGFGDAFIIAVVLAVLVDPVAQTKFATEWGRDLYWAIFSPNAPAEFREALQALAAPVAYITSCRYELEFKYPDGGSKEYYELDWRISLGGTALDRRGFKMGGRVFVISRHDGSPSPYKYWSFQVDDADLVEFDADDLISVDGAIAVDETGRTVLDQSMLPGVDLVPFGGRYRSERHVQTSRWKSDFIPLFQPRIVLRQHIIIRGFPLRELNFSIHQLGDPRVSTSRDGATNDSFTKSTRQDGQIELRCKIDHVGFPGQATLLSWKPIDLTSR